MMYNAFVCNEIITSSALLESGYILCSCKVCIAHFCHQGSHIQPYIYSIETPSIESES